VLVKRKKGRGTQGKFRMAGSQSSWPTRPGKLVWITGKLPLQPLGHRGNEGATEAANHGRQDK
jgi:hypothetical protein